MSNTINVNYMSSITNRYANIFSNKASAGVNRSEDMADAIKKVISEADVEEVSDTDEVVEAKSISKEDMTLEEYREYISDEIAGFPLHPSQTGNSFAINISDVSLQKMKDDPEYEEWLLNDVKGALGAAVPGWYQAIGGPSTYCVLNYENGEKGCWCHVWSKEYKGGSTDAKTMFDSESKDSIHTRRAERQKQIEKNIRKKIQQKRIRDKELAEDAYEAKLRNQEYLREYYNQKYYKTSFIQGWSGTPQFNVQNTPALPSSSASAAYEASFLTSDM